MSEGYQSNQGRRIVCWFGSGRWEELWRRNCVQKDSGNVEGEGNFSWNSKERDIDQAFFVYFAERYWYFYQGNREVLLGNGIVCLK